MASLVPLKDFIKEWSPTAATIAFFWCLKDIKLIKELLSNHVTELKAAINELKTGQRNLEAKLEKQEFSDRPGIMSKHSLPAGNRVFCSRVDLKGF